MTAKIIERIEHLEKLIANSSSEELIEQEYFSIRHDFDRIKDYALRDTEFKIVLQIEKRLNCIKKDNGFYDEEAELDMMFPNRHDEDFDEDSYTLDFDD